MKKFFSLIINKYWRIIYKIKYDIPFFDSYDFSKTINPIKYLEGVKSVAIIGKGASIFDTNPRNIIEECDCRILLNRVDVENLENYLGNKFEIQIAPMVADRNSIIQVLPRKLIHKYGVDLLIANLKKTDERFKLFNNYFHDRVNKMGFMPSINDMHFDLDVYKYSSEGRLTIASSVLRILYNVKSVKKIIFAGVDGYQYGYSQKQKEDGKVFYNININTTNPKETHGKFLIKYMIDSVIERNKYIKLQVYFPKKFKKFIDFPNHESFKFYD